MPFSLRSVGILGACALALTACGGSSNPFSPRPASAQDLLKAVGDAMRQAPDIHMKAPVIHTKLRDGSQILINLDLRYHGDDMSGTMKAPVEDKTTTLEFRVVQGRFYERIHLPSVEGKTAENPPPWVITTPDILHKWGIPATRSGLTTHLTNDAQEFSLGADKLVDGKRCYFLESNEEDAFLATDGPPLLIREILLSGDPADFTYESGPAIKAPADARPAPTSTSEDAGGLG